MVYFRRRGKTSGGGVSYLQYIQSTGSQYIKTGMKPSGNTRVEIKFLLTKNDNQFECVFGCRNKGSATAEKQFVLFKINNTTLRSDYFSQNHNFESIDFSKLILCDKNKNVTTINGETKSLSKSELSCENELIIFALYSAGSISSYTSMKLYYCKIYENDVLKRDYAPALDKDGKVCLYDKANKQYVYNAGSGAFIAG